MGYVNTYDECGKLICHIDIADVETFTLNGRTWVFEWHSFLGPTLLRKDGDPHRRPPAAFWEAVSLWLAMNPHRAYFAGKAPFWLQERMMQHEMIKWFRS